MAYQADLRLSRGSPGPAGVAVVRAGQGNNLHSSFAHAAVETWFLSMTHSDERRQNVVMPAGAAAAATPDSLFNFTAIVWLSTYFESIKHWPAFGAAGGWG